MQPIKIIICGDFRAAHPEKIKFSDEVTEIFANADLKVCNFEAPVHVEGAKPIEKSGPSLDQSSKSPAFLKGMGFNAILLANNHIMDFGEDGLYATKEMFNNDIVVGAGLAEEAFDVKIINISGFRIGIMSFVHHEFGTVDYLDEHTSGAAWINSPDVPGMIMNAKKKCDYLLVCPHAGIEHIAAPLPEWRRLYKRFVEWGADAVVGGHPHCPQGWEKYQGKLIYYSLGDFYFDELTYDELWYKSIVVEINFGDTIQFKEHFICFDDKTGLISVDNSEHIRNHMNYANRLLKNELEYNEYIDKTCATLWNGYKYALLRGLCAFSFKMSFKQIVRLICCVFLGNYNTKMLLNAIQSESARWVAERYLRLTIKNKK